MKWQTCVKMPTKWNDKTRSDAVISMKKVKFWPCHCEIKINSWRNWNEMMKLDNPGDVIGMKQEKTKLNLSKLWTLLKGLEKSLFPIETVSFFKTKMAEALDSGDNLTPSDQDPDLTLARKLQLVPMLQNLLIIINATAWQ